MPFWSAFKIKVEVLRKLQFHTICSICTSLALGGPSSNSKVFSFKWIQIWKHESPPLLNRHICSHNFTHYFQSGGFKEQVIHSNNPSATRQVWVHILKVNSKVLKKSKGTPSPLSKVTASFNFFLTHHSQHTWKKQSILSISNTFF